MPRRSLDLDGQKYGRLTIKGESKKGYDGRRWVNCVCDCGNDKFLRLASLRSGNTQSCGCLRQRSLNESS